MVNKFGVHSDKKASLGKQKIIIIALVAFILVLVVALSVVLQSRLSTEQHVEESLSQEFVEESATVTLLTPAENVMIGSRMTDLELKEIFWPKDSVPEGAITDMSSLSGKFAKSAIQYGEPILEKHLSDTAGDVGTIQIKPGMRAVTIEVSAKRSVEGWALPGSRVDVILTHSDQGELTSKVVVENARILSAGGDTSDAKQRLLSTQSRSGRRRIKATPTVTLELRPADALKIETAQQLGTLSLHLRAPEDNLSGGINSINQNDLSSNQNKTETSGQPGCNKGKMRIAGQEYWLDCDGKLIKTQ